MELVLQQCIQKCIDIVPLLYSSLVRPLVAGNAGGPPSTQLQALFIIHSSGPIPMGALAQRLYISKQQLTKLADAMAARGYILRVGHPQNRRITLLCLTDTGRALVRRVKRETFARMLPRFDALTPAEQQELSGAADTIRRLLKKLPG